MTPQRLTPSTHCQSRCVAVSSPPQAATPALLQSTCTAPNVSKARAASVCTWASSVTSVRTASALTPSACASPATAAIPGQCDDGGRAARGHRCHVRGEVEALNAAEMEIEDDHARARAADELQRRLARLRHEHARAGEEDGQQLAEGTAGIRVVFDDQDRTHVGLSAAAA